MPAVWEALWSRRRFLRRATALLSLVAGGRLLQRIFFPASLSAEQRATLDVVLDTLIPDGPFPGARRTGVLEPLLAECAATRQTRRALIEGIELVDNAARHHGGSSFAALDERRREAVLMDIASAECATLPWFFFRTVRDKAMRLHYAHPLARRGLGFDRAPQPQGYLDYWQAPRA
ncbi:MAG: gluconate 2-dehydrogenase subunit 3 family protein [Deltaproteobacteria bacterium]|nr:gluconate 2-dehydrogenase subunit 3 family protein [Deltaproteobacteria bacterium]